jgi:hypothetical protein
MELAFYVVQSRASRPGIVHLVLKAKMPAKLRHTQGRLNRAYCSGDKRRYTPPPRSWLRHANSRITMDVYTRGVSQHEREAIGRVVETMRLLNSVVRRCGLSTLDV